MKKTISYLVITLLPLLVLAQDATMQKRLNQLKAQKVGFITQRVNLSSEEAQVFWPLYNEFTQKKNELNKEMRAISAELRKNNNNLTSKQKTSMADNMINIRLKEAKLDLEYHEKFKQVLSIDKVLRLYQAENEFKSQLLNQIRKQSIKPKGQRPAQRK
jgi:hypothetical protein